MSRPAKHLVYGVLATGWTLTMLAGVGQTQTSHTSGEPARLSPKQAWRHRVLQQGRASRPPLRTASREVVNHFDFQSDGQVVRLDPPPTDPAYDDAGMDIISSDMHDMFPAGHGCNECGCGEMGCGGGCGGCYSGCGVAVRGWNTDWLLRDLSLFAGVHGFKGPPDRGRNGNFGFQEGVNFGAPLGWLGWVNGTGLQLGLEAVQSNFEGDRIDAAISGADHDQLFFTAGIFHRAIRGGLQWGMAYDMLHDVYRGETTDLRQIRSETGWVFSGGLREIGYFGAYGLGEERTIDGRLDPTDMFAFYYRRYFSGGGDGRFWAGFTGRGDGLIGADLRAPLGKRWALENRVNYLIPKQGSNNGGQVEESWGLTIQLVWYFGQPAACVRNSPFRPLLNVADNSLFLVDRMQ